MESFQKETLQYTQVICNYGPTWDNAGVPPRCLGVFLKYLAGTVGEGKLIPSPWEHRKHPLQGSGQSSAEKGFGALWHWSMLSE